MCEVLVGKYGVIICRARVFGKAVICFALLEFNSCVMSLSREIGKEVEEFYRPWPSLYQNRDLD